MRIQKEEDKTAAGLYPPEIQSSAVSLWGLGWPAVFLLNTQTAIDSLQFYIRGNKCKEKAKGSL